MWLLAPFRLCVRIFQRFDRERYAQTVAALSFTTLLGLVPMIALAAVLLHFVPFGQEFEAAIRKFVLGNFLPQKSGPIIVKYVGSFADRASRVTFLGIVLLVLTALIQMFTIERAFNEIWRVRTNRHIARRTIVHLLAMTLGPIVFGMSLAAMTFIMTKSLGWLDEPMWVTLFVNKGVPFVFASLLFGMLYWKVPNRYVATHHALIGGVIAAAGFSGMQYLFSTFIVKYGTYAVLYGSFSAIPVFLTWVYVSWLVIIIGAILVAEIPGLAKD
ncbi:MAG: YihY family inner membrane protein [Rhodocyclaceae bacterium]|jgi:membrane protein|nr:YihY family inner membrane protein [Rhodocyclaceae bacterium]MBK6907684.1 YihY family inner membrane protein [Rhodocyclaceae bacterium]